MWVVWGSPTSIRNVEIWAFISGRTHTYHLKILGEYVVCLSQRCVALKEKKSKVKMILELAQKMILWAFGSSEGTSLLVSKIL